MLYYNFRISFNKVLLGDSFANCCSEPIVRLHSVVNASCFVTFFHECILNREHTVTFEIKLKGGLIDVEIILEKTQSFFIFLLR